MKPATFPLIDVSLLPRPIGVRGDSHSTQRRLDEPVSADRCGVYCEEIAFVLGYR
jgi:hypothetical protein